MGVINSGTSKVIVCRGALATERRLIAELDALQPSGLDDLASPVRIIVPSRSLRLHLLRRLARERGAVAGIVIQTIGGLAHEILERTAVAVPAGNAGFEIIVRRLAKEEPALASELDELQNGYDVVIGTVRDLVDAGFSPEHEEGVLEKIVELAPSVPRSNRDRASALVRVAARAMEASKITGGYPRSASYGSAANALLEHGAVALPSRAVVIHGFADLTGVAADLLTAVLKVVVGVALMDLAPDPANPDRLDSGNAYVDRLRLRLGGLSESVDSSPPRGCEVHFAEAPDLEAEARWVAESVRSMVATGVEPEEIGVVARHLGLIGPALRRQLNRLGVPCSGVGARVAGGLLRRKARRLADLLRRGSRAELDLWLEVSEGLDGGASLLLGTRVLSLARLQDLASLDPADRRIDSGVPLPMGRVTPRGDASGEEEPEPSILDKSRIVKAGKAARAVGAVLDRWPNGLTAETHRARTEELLRVLGWDLDQGFGAGVLDSVRALARDFPLGLELHREEWTAALTRVLDGLGEVPIGGSGGGVQILTVMEARARTFTALFLCGVNRGVFPRIAPDDPLLPDPVRARLSVDVLPEMPVKARSADEERYLFAQLLSAANTIRLSWHLAADGKRTAPSSFVERLLAGRETSTCRTVGSFWSRDRRRRGPRPAYELAVDAALHGEGDSVLRTLNLAIADARSMVDDGGFEVPPERASKARIEILPAVEPSGKSDPVGPWFGFVGPASSPGERLWVTQLEAVARCPWQAFVGRRLRVRPLPDPHLGLPDPDDRLLGEVVHQVLEGIVTGDETGRRWPIEEASLRPARVVPWPSKERLEDLLVIASQRVVFTEGLTGFGLAHLLAARARPVLEVAGEVEWAGSVRLDGVLAAEVEGTVQAGRSGPAVHFRADRLDIGPVATDYKTGSPLTTSVQEKTRRRYLVENVRSGRLLQGSAYAGVDPSGAGTGRYVFLRPDIGGAPPEVRVVEVAGCDEELGAAFEDAVVAIEASMRLGSAFPRFKHPTKKNKEPCRYCQVREACRRDDPEFTGQLARLMETEDGAAEPAVTAARTLWWLGEEREQS